MDLVKAVRHLVFVGLMAFLAFACTTTDEVGALSQNVGTATVATNKMAYATTETVTVSWTGLPGNQNDWVAIANQGASPQDVTAWTFVNGQVNGSFEFNPLQTGVYEARVYQSGTYNILATYPFTVGTVTTGVTVVTDKTAYQGIDTITVTWTGMPGNANDYVALNIAGSAPDQGFVAWTYTNGQVNGSFTFNPIAGGSYEARMYKSGTYTVLATANFAVSGAMISTDKQIYAPTDTVTVSWTGMPGNPTDYVAISAAGAPANSTIALHQINGAASGSFAFNPLPVGNYEARAYTNGSTTIVAMSTFSVNGASITTDKSDYAAGDTVTLAWAGMPGNASDYISINTAGAPVNDGFQAFTYINAQTSGSFTFNPLPAGSYEARAYRNGTYTILASSPFTVAVSNACTSASTRPVFGNMTSGDLVISSTQTQNTAAVTAPLDSSVLFMSIRENEPSPKFGGVVCELHAADYPAMGIPAGVTCTRNNPGTDSGSSDGSVTIHWSVATFTSGVTVQRGLADTSFNPATTSIASVDLSTSFVVLSGMANGGSGWGNNEFVRAQLTDPNTLDIRTAVAGTEVAWQVVTMVGSMVQRGSASLAAADTQATVTIPAVPSGTVAFASYTTDNANGISAAGMMVQASLASTTSLLFKRDAGGSGISIAWEVVSLPFATHSGLTTFTAGQASRIESVPGIMASSCVGISSSQAIFGQSTGSTSYAGTDVDLVGEGGATFTAGADSLAVQRSTSQSSAEFPWTVIDFSRDCTGF